MGVRCADGDWMRQHAFVCATHCDLLTTSFPICLERGAGLPEVRRIPYFPEDATKMLAPYKTVILADAHDPVSFFAYPGAKGRFLDETEQVLTAGGPGVDAAAVLEKLADFLQTVSAQEAVRETGASYELPDLPTGDLDAGKACRTIAALQPEGAIIVDEGLTSTMAYFALAAKVRPHAYMTLTGGAIGWGLPSATGAAIACPERPVINLQADGSAMYTVQSLWTQARQRSDVTTLIFSNRRYRDHRRRTVPRRIQGAG